MKLNQVIAILQGVKSEATKKKSKPYQIAQKQELFEGISRTYEPENEEGFVYPSESKPLQLKVDKLLEDYAEACKDLFDYSATQDWANTQAIADVVVGGVVILKDAPIAYLLFLEKQLADIKTFVSSLPEQDISEEWNKDEQRDCWATTPRYTTKTKKITKPVVLYEATKEHPAQVQQVSEDIPEGKWKTVKFSGALTKSRKNELLKRVEELTRAVVFARESANSIEVQKKEVSHPIFDYLFKL